MKLDALRKFVGALFVFALVLLAQGQHQVWTPDTDWAHWRLGQRADLQFLQANHMTVTFGAGAPRFEDISREEFNRRLQEAKAANAKLHEQGYVALSYLTSSLNGSTATSADTPQKEQIRLSAFWREHWKDYEDYIGPKPPEDPTTWITVRADGTFPHYRYAPYGRKTTGGFETWGCPNNPHFVRMMEGRVRAQAEAGIDGSYVDWTQIAGETCYCKYCQRSFSQYLKQNLPPEIAHAKYGAANYDQVVLPKKRGEPFWMEWIMFRGHCVAEFHHRLREVARQYNPHFMLSGNVFGGFGYGPIAYDAAGNMEMLGRDGYDDFVYSEIQEFLDSAPRKDDQGTKITNSPALKFLAAATHGKPVVVYAVEITPPVFPKPTERCLSAMAQLNIAEAVANHAIFREKRETPPGATEIYRFLAANEPSLRDMRLHANVAVVTSLRQYLADELSFAFSASRVLADNGIAHVMLTEDDITSGGMQLYDVVVLPYLPLLSTAKQQALLKYAKAGGTLLVVGASGAKDEYGLRQKQVALAEALGAQAYPATGITRKLGQGRIIYVPVAIPATRFLIPMKAHGDFTTFGPTMADVFADIPEGYTRNRMDSALRTLLEQVAQRVKTIAGARATRVLSAAPYVEISTMLDQSGKRMLLHAVNYDVTVEGTITPARNVKLQIALPIARKARQVTWSGILGEMKPIRYQSTMNAGRQILQLDLDQIGIYGLMNIEMD